MPQNSTIKDVATLAAICERRYARVWLDELVEPRGEDWPYLIRVGKPSKDDLERGYARISALGGAVAAWAASCGLSCRTEQRKVGRMSYPVLSHVAVPNMPALARAVGKGAHWELYSTRAAALRELFPSLDAARLRSVLAALSRSDANNADFELVCAAAQWFAQHDAAGYTPREVPLEGFHAKWLDTAGHRQMVCALAGVPSLDLRDRPRLVRFHYIDPSYLSLGLREHDAWLEGDANAPAYAPRIVVICENRDSALWFLPVEGAIVVQGDGMAGVSTLASAEWLFQAQLVLYWGDIDIHGFMILAAYRERGLNVQSMLMDQATYDTYRRFGTSVDMHGRPLSAKPDAKPLPGLNDEENALYLRLCSPDHTDVRRVEQERIPLTVARTAVLELVEQLD